MYNKCNECDKKIITCGCKDRVNLACTYYKGDTLMPLQIEDDMDGATIIKVINDYLKELIIDLQVDPTIIENIGNGADILSDSGHYFCVVFSVEYASG